jgi:hypothetical protein
MSGICLAVPCLPRQQCPLGCRHLFLWQQRAGCSALPLCWLRLLLRIAWSAAMCLLGDVTELGLLPPLYLRGLAFSLIFSFVVPRFGYSPVYGMLWGVRMFRDYLLYRFPLLWREFLPQMWWLPEKEVLWKRLTQAVRAKGSKLYSTTIGLGSAWSGF